MNFLGIGLVDWIVILVYLVGVTAIGIWSYTRVKDLSDYFMGGRRFGKVFMMFFAFGSGTSSEQANSVVAGTWKVGLAGIWWQFLWLFATPFYWIVAPMMRRMRALTTSDFFEARFNTSTSVLYSIFGIMMSIVFIAGGLFASGKMIDAMTGGELERQAVNWDVNVPKVEWNTEQQKVDFGWRHVAGYEYAILAMTVMFVLYGMAGGLNAAVITDFIQGILTIMFSFLLLPFVFGMIGGFGNLHSEGEIKPGMFDLVLSAEASLDVAKELGAEPITPFYVFMLWATGLAGIVVQPHIMGVCGAGKTEFEGRFGFTVGNFLKRFCTVAWTFTGLACMVWYLGSGSTLTAEERAVVDPRVSLEEVNAVLIETGAMDRYDKEKDGVKDGKLDETERKAADHDFSDKLFGRAAAEILPTIMPGLVGLLLASLLAAVMSTSDAQMVVSSGLFTENIYRRFIALGRTQHHYVWVGRISGVVIVALAILLQSTFSDVIDALKVIIKVPAAIGISLWFGVVWRGWTPAAVWVSASAAMAAWGHAVLFPMHYGTWFPEMVREGPKGPEMMDVWQMFIYMTAGIAAGLITCRFTKRSPQEKLDHFFRLLHTPVQPGEETNEPCTLPENPPEPEPKLFSHPDIELPKPTLVGMAGFAGAWVLVVLIIWMTYWLGQAL